MQNMASSNIQTEGEGRENIPPEKGSLLASGILGILSPAVSQVDQKVEEVRYGKDLMYAVTVNCSHTPCLLGNGVVVWLVYENYVLQQIISIIAFSVFGNF